METCPHIGLHHAGRAARIYSLAFILFAILMLLLQLNSTTCLANDQCHSKLSAKLKNRLGELQAAGTMDKLLNVIVVLRMESQNEMSNSLFSGESGVGKDSSKEDSDVPEHGREQLVVDRFVDSFVSWAQRQGFKIISINRRIPFVGLQLAADSIELVNCRKDVLEIDLILEMQPLTE